MLFLLQSGVSVAIDDLPFEHLVSILVFLLVLAAVIFVAGFSVKLGDKEINIGGFRRLLARKEKDTILKENLKRFSDDVDHETEADLYDLIDDIDSKIKRLALTEHCYFTFENFSSIVKKQLEKRVRRNNLRGKLAETSRDKYVSAVMRDVEERYELLQAKVSQAKCGETYAEFIAIKESFRGVLDGFFDGAKGILVSGMKKKIERYNEVKDQFKTAGARKICCDDCIAKNKRYIKNLTGEDSPVV